MRWLIVVIGLLAIAGCGEGGPVPTEDAATADSDAAAVASDAATTPGQDASMPADDATVSADDAAMPVPDASETPDAELPGPDAGQPVDAAVVQVDAGATAPDAGLVPDGGTAGCTAGAAGCTCVDEPADSANACRHSFGGVYSNHACSASYQCCDGTWKAGQGSCGACACVEVTGTAGCVPAADAVSVCFPSWVGVSEPLPATLQQSMDGVSWRTGCPLPLDQLSLLTMSHWGFDGAVKTGLMVVATNSAPNVLKAFRTMYEARFPVERMKLVDDYGADDDLSMADNNTSAFNCRPITGGGAFSQHSYGTAIDVNPVQNPYVYGTLVLPPAGSSYLNRDDVRPGMIVDPGPALGAFKSIGWFWGGDWTSPQDYQHFSINDS
ncbi:MAG TPA: M15 family metallopeptidase [Myxococcales bacterium]|jgi:predicted small lipoprotein YifL